MSGTRVVVETPCDHGYLQDHCDHGPAGGTAHKDVDICPTASWCVSGGGSRRTLTPGEYVLIEKVDGEWPEWVVGKMTGIYNQRRRLDALAGTDHTEGTP